eukprot:5399490-Amphidinium_carterae.2
MAARRPNKAARAESPRCVVQTTRTFSKGKLREVHLPSARARDHTSVTQSVLKSSVLIHAPLGLSLKAGQSCAPEADASNARSRNINMLGNNTRHTLMATVDAMPANGVEQTVMLRVLAAVMRICASLHGY